VYKTKTISITLSGSGTILRYQNESVKEVIAFKRFRSRGIIVKAKFRSRGIKVKKIPFKRNSWNSKDSDQEES
jgi:hypothetical protein